MTSSKLVVVWSSEDILSSSVEIFLAGRDDWKVVSISRNEDMEALLPTLETGLEDLVIIHPRCQKDHTNLPLKFLQEHPAIKVILISLENNAMEIYSKQQIMVQHTSDLMNAIENEPLSLADDWLVQAIEFYQVLKKAGK